MKSSRWSVKKTVIAVGILGLGVAGVLVFKNSQKAAPANSAAGVQQKTAQVIRGNISSELSSSGIISPKDTYQVTSLVEGEVVSAEFEIGDQVEKGQILYQIDPSSIATELQSVNNSLVRAQDNQTDAEKEYAKAASKYSGRTYLSTQAGYIKTLYVKAGDTISSGTKIADLYNDQTMKLRVPFLTVEADLIGVGNEGVVTLSDTGEMLPGVVTAVSQMEETLEGGRLVKYVTVEVGNPGGLTTAHLAAVTIGSAVCSAEGLFQPVTDTVLTADLDMSVKAEELLISEGDFAAVGTPVFRMDAESVDKYLKNFKNSVTNAQESVENAQNKVEVTNDNYSDYTITAPIAGQVIKKEVKAGDKVSKSTSGTTTMAVIYDLSQMTFQMSIDELDIKKVKVGQKVAVTADAMEDEQFSGTVTNISLESSNSNGVSNYPVTVTLEDLGELLPGMSVDGTIILDQSEDTLLIPVDSLMRGNRVYVKDETVKEAQGNAPAGFRAVEVKTGLVSDTFVEILEGLNEGDEVYVAETTKSSEGMQMRIMPGMGGASGGMGGGAVYRSNGGAPRQ